MNIKTNSNRSSIGSNRVLFVERCIVTLEGRERYRDIRLPRGERGKSHFRQGQYETRGVPWQHVAGDPEAGDRRFKFRRGVIFEQGQRAVPQRMVVIDPKTRHPKLNDEGQFVYRTVNKHVNVIVSITEAEYDEDLNRWVAVER